MSQHFLANLGICVLPVTAVHPHVVRQVLGPACPWGPVPEPQASASRVALRQVLAGCTGRPMSSPSGLLFMWVLRSALPAGVPSPPGTPPAPVNNHPLPAKGQNHFLHKAFAPNCLSVMAIQFTYLHKHRFEIYSGLPQRVTELQLCVLFI